MRVFFISITLLFSIQLLALNHLYEVSLEIFEGKTQISSPRFVVPEGQGATLYRENRSDSEELEVGVTPTTGRNSSQVILELVVARESPQQKKSYRITPKLEINLNEKSEAMIRNPGTGEPLRIVVTANLKKEELKPRTTSDARAHDAL